MKQYLLPLWIFCGGQLALLVVFLLFPAVETVRSQLETDTAAIASTFWGWTWVVGAVKLFIFLAVEAGILWATAKAFLANRN